VCGLGIHPARTYPVQSETAVKESAMIAKQPRRTMEFGEQDLDFIIKLAGDVGCHYSKYNERTYNLNKFKSDVQGEMGVFAWVHKEGADSFWISTRKVWVEEAREKMLTGGNLSGINCFSRDTQRAGDSIYLDTKDDYQKTVSILTLVKDLH
jgi:hypothetical protein